MQTKKHETRQSSLLCLIWMNSISLGGRQQLGISAPLLTAAGNVPFPWHTARPFSRITVHRPGQSNSVQIIRLNLL